MEKFTQKDLYYTNKLNGQSPKGMQSTQIKSSLAFDRQYLPNKENNIDIQHRYNSQAKTPLNKNNEKRPSSAQNLVNDQKQSMSYTGNTNNGNDNLSSNNMNGNNGYGINNSAGNNKLSNIKQITPLTPSLFSKFNIDNNNNIFNSPKMTKLTFKEPITYSNNDKELQNSNKSSVPSSTGLTRKQSKIDEVENISSKNITPTMKTGTLVEKYKNYCINQNSISKTSTSNKNGIEANSNMHKDKYTTNNIDNEYSHGQSYLNKVPSLSSYEFKAKMSPMSHASNERKADHEIAPKIYIANQTSKLLEDLRLTSLEFDQIKAAINPKNSKVVDSSLEEKTPQYNELKRSTSNIDDSKSPKNLQGREFERSSALFSKSKNLGYQHGIETSKSAKYLPLEKIIRSSQGKDNLAITRDFGYHLQNKAIDSKDHLIDSKDRALDFSSSYKPNTTYSKSNRSFSYEKSRGKGGVMEIERDISSSSSLVGINDSNQDLRFEGLARTFYEKALSMLNQTERKSYANNEGIPSFLNETHEVKARLGISMNESKIKNEMLYNNFLGRENYNANLSANPNNGKSSNIAFEQTPIMIKSNSNLGETLRAADVSGSAGYEMRCKEREKELEKFKEYEKIFQEREDKLKKEREHLEREFEKRKLEREREYQRKIKQNVSNEKVYQYVLNQESDIAREKDRDKNVRADQQYYQKNIDDRNIYDEESKPMNSKDAAIIRKKNYSSSNLKQYDAINVSNENLNLNGSSKNTNGISKGLQDYVSQVNPGTLLPFKNSILNDNTEKDLRVKLEIGPQSTKNFKLSAIDDNSISQSDIRSISRNSYSTTNRFISSNNSGDGSAFLFNKTLTNSNSSYMQTLNTARPLNSPTSNNNNNNGGGLVSPKHYYGNGLPFSYDSNNQFEPYYMNNLYRYFKSADVDNYFCKLYKEHFMQSIQAMQFCRNLKPVDQAELAKKRVFLTKKESHRGIKSE